MINCNSAEKYAHIEYIQKKLISTGTWLPSQDMKQMVFEIFRLGSHTYLSREPQKDLARFYTLTQDINSCI